MNKSNTERVPFKLFVMPCCNHQLCWVNPRLPSHCPECGVFIHHRVREGIMFSDDSALLITHPPKTWETIDPERGRLPPFIVVSEWQDPDPRPMRGPRSHPYGAGAYYREIDGQAYIFPSKEAAEAYDANKR